MLYRIYAERNHLSSLIACLIYLIITVFLSHTSYRVIVLKEQVYYFRHSILLFILRLFIRLPDFEKSYQKQTNRNYYRATILFNSIFGIALMQVYFVVFTHNRCSIFCMFIIFIISSICLGIALMEDSQTMKENIYIGVVILVTFVLEICMMQLNWAISNMQIQLVKDRYERESEFHYVLR